MGWNSAKTLAATAIGLDRDGLHIIAALLILFVAAILSRRPLSHPFPLLAVFAVCIADALFGVLIDGNQTPISIRDILVVMSAPAIIFALSRFVPVDSARGKGRSIRIMLRTPPDYFRRLPDIVDAEYHDVPDDAVHPTVKISRRA